MATTVAPDTDDPEGSTTVPLKLPSLPARATTGRKMMAAASAHARAMYEMCCIECDSFCAPRVTNPLPLAAARTLRASGGYEGGVTPA